MSFNGPWGDRIPTREEAIEGAAAVYLDAELRIETEKAIAQPHQEDAPAGKGEGKDQNTSQENQSMSIIADAPAGYQQWPDIRTIHDVPTLMVDSIVYSIAAASGQQLIVRVDVPGRGPLIHVHPDLVKAVKACYRDLGASITAAARSIPAADVAGEAQLPTAAPAQGEQRQEADGTTPCSIFTWCDGHEPTCPESDGVHMTTIGFGRYAGGEPKYLYAIFYLPVEDDDPPAHWSFSMPEGAEWSFGPDAVDAEIQEGIDELVAARNAIKRFLLTAVTS